MVNPKFNISDRIYRFCSRNPKGGKTGFPEVELLGGMHRDANRLPDKKSRFEFWIAKQSELDNTVEHLSLKAHILCQISHFREFLDEETIGQVLEEALDCAFESGYETAIDRVLHSLANYYFYRDCRSDGITCLQARVLFNRDMWPNGIVDSLKMVADNWVEEETTLSAGLAMYDWLFVIAPSHFDIPLRKYTKLIKQGRRAEVESESTQFDLKDIASVNRYIAANWALRRKKRASAVIQQVLSDESGYFDEMYKYMLKLFFKVSQTPTPM